MKKKLQLLDCTLRDGGYYVDWDFSDHLVQDYLNAIARSGVNVIELGFRFRPQKKFLGPYAYSTDSFLKRMDLPKEQTLAVMINGKEYVDETHSGGTLLKSFAPAEESPVSLVRIAIHIDAVATVTEQVKVLSGLGYRVAINLMQAGGKPESVVGGAVEKVSNLEGLEALYFADSLGNMSPVDVAGVTQWIRSGWDRGVGFHAHNNKGLGLINSLTAIESGADWVDSTILGMGRGAGNTNTESLLIELSERKMGQYFPEQLLEIVLTHFASLHRKHGWGSNMLYHLSAASNIHPTYVQEMLASSEYSVTQLKSAIDCLRDEQGASSYSEVSLRSALADYKGASATGSWSPRPIEKDRRVLILGAGPSVEKYREGILSYIEERKPLVLALNACDSIPDTYIDYFVSAHKMRFLTDSSKYALFEKPLICPFADVPEAVKKNLGQTEVLNYGMAVESGAFEVGEMACKVPLPLAAAYAISIATASKASQIDLVGFDGYSGNKQRQADMEHVLESYQALEKSLPIVSLTPTSYAHLAQGSVFSPDFSN